MEKNLKKIALIGQPNVGKSSLFNRIANKRIAIVSDVSGTTRDVRRHEIEIIDRSALLLDTGGIDDTNDEIFSNVKKKAVKTAKEADIILFIVDGKNIPDDKDKELKDYMILRAYRDDVEMPFLKQKDKEKSLFNLSQNINNNIALIETILNENQIKMDLTLFL